LKSTTSKADLGRLAGGAAGLGWNCWAGAGSGSWKVIAGLEGGGAGLLTNAGWIFCCGAKFWNDGTVFLGGSGCLNVGLAGAEFLCCSDAGLGAGLAGDFLEGDGLLSRAGKLANPEEEDEDLGGDGGDLGEAGLEGAAFLIGEGTLFPVGAAFLMGDAPLDEPRDLFALKFL